MGDDDDHNEGLRAGPTASWRLNVSDFHMPERPKEPPFVARVFLRSHGTYGHLRPTRSEILQKCRSIVSLVFFSFPFAIHMQLRCGFCGN
jgi:hypothetical protein